MTNQAPNRNRRSPSRRNRRSGFMLHELFVLALIPLALMALVLPAVQRAREAARRMHCNNNLKQIGLALSNYENTYLSFPPGVIHGSSNDAPILDEPTYLGNFGWGALLLSHMEQLPLAAQFAEHQWNMPRWLESGGANQVKLLAEFRCPSDAAPECNVGRQFAGPSGTPVFALPLSNYVGVNGSGPLRRFPWPVAVDDGVAASAGPGANGVFVVNAPCRLAAIPDGLSNTAVMGERVWTMSRSGWRASAEMHRAASALGTRGIRENSQHGLADALGTGRFGINQRVDDRDPQRRRSGVRQGFSSHHPGGALFLLADGAVRFISQSIDADMDPATGATRTSEVDSLFERLLSRNDGQTMEDF